MNSFFQKFRKGQTTDASPSTSTTSDPAPAATDPLGQAKQALNRALQHLSNQNLLNVPLPVLLLELHSAWHADPAQHAEDQLSELACAVRLTVMPHVHRNGQSQLEETLDRYLTA